MKTFNVLLISLMLGVQLSAQLANSYPNDLGMENDSNVLFFEDFEGDLADILAKYPESSNTQGMFLDADVPAGSLGQKSLKITSTGGVTNGGVLTQHFIPGFDSIVYFRFYVQYSSLSKGYLHHVGGRIGGQNPLGVSTGGSAGTCGLGDSRMSMPFEPVWDKDGETPGMDTYLYWADMHSWGDVDGVPSCYGNVIVMEGRLSRYGAVSPDRPVMHWDQWMCVEIMVKLNDPVTEYNGELRIWQDGKEVGHWGPGFPNGHWTSDRWVNNPDEEPFQGFRWRTDPALVINWMMLKLYQSDPDAPSTFTKYDQVVMATKYIGPIYDPSSVNIDAQAALAAIKIYPNPTSGVFSVSGLPEKSDLTIFNVRGEELCSSKPNEASSTIDLSGSPKGVYFLKIQRDKDVVGIRKLVIK